MLLDLKAACRELAKNRWFTCVTVLTLALGLGANAAIFGVVNKLLLNPLPYADADRLVFVGLDFPGLPFTFPLPDFVVRALRADARTLDGVEAYVARNVLAYDETGGRVLHGMRHFRSSVCSTSSRISKIEIIGKKRMNKNNSATKNPSVPMKSAHSQRVA